MILLILLHKGRGGGLSDMFGGGISSGLGGSSVAERNLDRITVGAGVIWFACVIALGLLLKVEVRRLIVASPARLRGDSSVAGGGSAIRGSRVGAGPMGEAERGEAAPRQRVIYFCAHASRVGDHLRGRRGDPGLVGLPALRAAGEPGLGQPAAARPRSSRTRRTSRT